MIKKIIVSICLLFSLALFAQEGTSSPYSFYGIGDVRFKIWREYNKGMKFFKEHDLFKIWYIFNNNKWERFCVDIKFNYIIN